MVDLDLDEVTREGKKHVSSAEGDVIDQAFEAVDHLKQPAVDFRAFGRGARLEKGPSLVLSEDQG